MSVFDIVGPVMVGPSSSHTAGAVRMGYVTRRLLDEEVSSAEILLYGSFLATGAGHGTKQAIAAGLLGMKPDDVRIPESLGIAANMGVKFTFGEAHLKQAHPNAEVTSMLSHKSVNVATMQLYRESRGGNAVMVIECDQEIPEESVKWLEHLEGVLKVTYYSLKDEI